MAVLDSKAAEWSIDPTLAVRGEFNDNILLTTLSHNAVYGQWVSPTVKFKGETERLTVETTAGADFVTYYGEKGLDITNLAFPGAVRYKGERDQWELSGAFVRDNTLVGELQETGVVNQRTQRNMRTVHPSWRRSLTEQLSSQLDYQITDTSYTDAARFNLFDYRTHSLSGGLIYQWTERTELDANVYYLNYHSPNINLRSEYYGAQIGVVYQYSEKLKLGLSGGLRDVSSRLSRGAETTRDQDSVWVFSTTLEYQAERTLWKSSFGREISPSGLGFLIQTDHLSASVTHQVTPRVSLGVNGDAYWIKPAGSAGSLPNSLYFAVEPKGRWRLSEYWALDVSYRYQQLTVEQADLTASQHAMNIMVTYQPAKWWSQSR